MDESVPVSVNHQPADSTIMEAPASPKKMLSSPSSRESLDPTAQFEDVIGVPGVPDDGEKVQVSMMANPTPSDQSQASQKKRSTLKRLFMSKDKKDELENDELSGGNTESGKGRMTKMLHKVQSRASRVLEKMTPGHRGESGGRSSSTDGNSPKLGGSEAGLTSSTGVGEQGSSTSSQQPGGGLGSKGKSKTLRRIASGLSTLMAKGGGAAKPPNVGNQQVAVAIAADGPDN